MASQVCIWYSWLFLFLARDCRRFVCQVMVARMLKEDLVCQQSMNFSCKAKPSKHQKMWQCLGLAQAERLALKISNLITMTRGHGRIMMATAGNLLPTRNPDNRSILWPEHMATGPSQEEPAPLAYLACPMLAGLIDPNSYLWLESRRPLVAHFQHCRTGMPGNMHTAFPAP